MTPREWPLDQMAFLVKHYTDWPMDYIVAGLAEIGENRSVNAIHSKARSLDLPKRNLRGDYQKKRAAKLAGPRITLRARVIDLLTAEQEASLKHIVEVTGGTHSAVWKVCISLVNQNNAHIPRWDRSGNASAMVIRIGRGESAPKPAGNKMGNARTIPIPRPPLGWLGCTF